MTRSLITIVVVCLALFAVQAMFTNRRGAESDVKKQLASMVPQAWHFIALQYCYGMLNRTYVVFVTDTMICGARVRGLLAAPVVVNERWFDPYFFPRPWLVRRYTRVDLTSPEFKQLSLANFQIALVHVEDVRFNAEPKWGMETLPYSGRIHLRARNGIKEELILLGRQDGPALVERLRASISNARRRGTIADP